MFSYREPIAKKIGGGIVWVTSRKFSVTTSKHTNMVMGALARKNWKIQHGPDPDPVCRHCEMARSAHVDATKCLYEPTSFEEAA